METWHLLRRSMQSRWVDGHLNTRYFMQCEKQVATPFRRTSEVWWKLSRACQQVDGACQQRLGFAAEGASHVKSRAMQAGDQSVVAGEQTGG